MAAARFYIGDDLNDKEVGKILKKIKLCKVVDLDSNIEAMVGCMILGAVHVIICTDSNLVYFDYNGGLKIVASKYPYEAITSISMLSAMGNPQILLGVEGTGGVTLKVLAPPKEVMKMIDYITQRISSKKAVESPVEVPTVADDIKKYFDLKEQGIITAEEFEAKKKQLMGL